MLTYLLAIAVGLGSFGLYMSAFFLPELHRKYDLVWSGVGLFYSLVLWVCAERITGGLLLGQMASVALLGWLGWQTLKLRLAATPIDQRTQIPASANSASEIIQVTIEQMRANFQKSATRSPLAARLNLTIDRIEEQWISWTSWLKAIQTTLSDEAESIAPPASVVPPAAEAPPPVNPAMTDQTETIDVAELADRLEQASLDAELPTHTGFSDPERSSQPDQSQSAEGRISSSDPTRSSDQPKNRPRRV